MTDLPPGSFGSFVHQPLRQTLAVELWHGVAEETLERLDSRQDDDCSRISLRMEYWNLTTINCGEFPDFIVAGIWSAIACLSSKQEWIECFYRQGKLFKMYRGIRFAFPVDSGFTKPNTSKLLGIKKEKKKVQRRVPMFRVMFLWFRHTHTACISRGAEWSIKIFNCSQNFTFARFARKI